MFWLWFIYSQHSLVAEMTENLLLWSDHLVIFRNGLWIVEIYYLLGEKQRRIWIISPFGLFVYFEFCPHWEGNFHTGTGGIWGF